jgi:hypothetical protein
LFIERIGNSVGMSANFTVSVTRTFSDLRKAEKWALKQRIHRNSEVEFSAHEPEEERVVIRGMLAQWRDFESVEEAKKWVESKHPMQTDLISIFKLENGQNTQRYI